MELYPIIIQNDGNYDNDGGDGNDSNDSNVTNSIQKHIKWINNKFKSIFVIQKSNINNYGKGIFILKPDQDFPEYYDMKWLTIDNIPKGIMSILSDIPYLKLSYDTVILDFIEDNFTFLYILDLFNINKHIALNQLKKNKIKY